MLTFDPTALQYISGVTVAEGQVIADTETVGPDEWLDLSVDLSRFAARQTQLSIENRTNNWHNEWAYWNNIQVIIE